MKCLLIILSLILVSFTFQKTSVLSVKQTLAEPNTYNGKLVTVQGYYVSEFENSSLWQTKKESKSIEFEHSIWIGGILKQAELLDLKGNKVKFGYFHDSYIEITGIYRSKVDSTGSWPIGHGHLGVWPAELLKITNMREISKPSKQKGQ